MRKQERYEILAQVAKMTDAQLEDEYYRAVWDTLGSDAEKMYEMEYDMADILEQERYEKYLREYADILTECCMARNIELWQNKKEVN